MARLVPSLTGRVVLSGTETSCHRKPKPGSSHWLRSKNRALNCANIESYGFYLTHVGAFAATAAALGAAS